MVNEAYLTMMTVYAMVDGNGQHEVDNKIKKRESREHKVR